MSSRKSLIAVCCCKAEQKLRSPEIYRDLVFAGAHRWCHRLTKGFSLAGKAAVSKARNCFIFFASTVEGFTSCLYNLCGCARRVASLGRVLRSQRLRASFSYQYGNRRAGFRGRRMALPTEAGRNLKCRYKAFWVWYLAALGAIRGVSRRSCGEEYGWIWPSPRLVYRLSRIFIKRSLWPWPAW